jgi:RNA polymerase-binding transcription factor DksA
MTIDTATSRVAPSPTATVPAELRAALVAELDERRVQLRDLHATVDELTGQSDTDSLLEREIAQRSSLQVHEVILDIGEALARIDAGTYGRCEQCGGPIAPARLEAIPYARSCVHCPPPPPRPAV